MNFIPTDLQHPDALGAILIKEYLVHAEDEEQTLNARKVLKYYNPLAYNTYWGYLNLTLERNVQSLIRKMKYQAQKRDTDIVNIYHEFSDTVEKNLLAKLQEENEQLLISCVELPSYLELSLIDDLYQLS